MKKLMLLCFILVFQFGFSQENQNNEKPFYGGFGLGMDFGGFGLKGEYMLFKYAGPFVGIGYNLYGLGFNGGIIAKPFPDNKFTPYVLGMGGYTGVIVIRGAAQFDRIDYGFSLGGGFELKTKNNNVFQFGLVFPFRSQDFRDYYVQLQNNPNIQLDANLSPVALTLGYKFVIR
jgi:hypothetical protein